MSDIQKVMTALILVMRVLVLLELIQQLNFKALFWNFFLCNLLDLMKLIIPCLCPCFNAKIVLRTEPERQERERKGDLDRFERVDGDRNLTSVNLAVKKVISLLRASMLP